MGSGTPRLIAEKIGVRFGGLAALSDVDLDLGEGEIVGLIGSNGAGKSTLINVLSGFQRATEGRVAYGDLPLNRLAPHRIARSGIVRTFQSVRLFPNLSVVDNVVASAAVLGSAAPPARDLLHLLGLFDQAARPAGSLSYAHQRRLAIARALALRPKFLLLDEPAAGMTPEEVADLDATLVSLRNQTGLGLLLVEHNMALVMAVCERLVVLDGGRVIARGAPQEVRTNPVVRRAFLGSLEAAT
ncbi:ABC transporter ATP-binding protein [Mesorhizobium sp. CO1-1-8]|uniref:ABC transporter ATP-binding protein n=1 Tax=Mesorhizobium sp. CO1-1-8 TaxID=2876631 RepID=UPI001CD0ADA3|nr:ABC transporter ATP-binding protein [Mesorhizobium sp. CO1-1-8]MBZ9772207.1 ABC transporter ATP-binding protein [Mesorhizobium sp. CO1-1-8]